MTSGLKVLESKHIHPNVRVDTCELPDGRIIAPVIMEFNDWACVVALTRQQDVILIRLYRHGVGQVIVEIPGGTIDPGETAREAVQRELLEETGYGGGKFIELAVLSPNPDNHTNRIHIFLALDVEKRGDQHPDDADWIAIHPTPLEDVIRMAKNGEFLQTMHTSALFFALSYLDRIS